MKRRGQKRVDAFRARLWSLIGRVDRMLGSRREPELNAARTTWHKLLANAYVAHHGARLAGVQDQQEILDRLTMARHCLFPYLTEQGPNQALRHVDAAVEMLGGSTEPSREGDGIDYAKDSVVVDGVECSFVPEMGASTEDLVLQLRAQGLDAFVTPDGAISWRPPETKSGVVMAKVCGTPRECGKPAAVVDGRQVCPECGAPADTGYGLMGGGIGAYVFCTGDACDWFWKMQDEEG